MGETTGIAWTDHTFNPWWGCVRVSPGCTNCYAEAWDKYRGGESGPHWGPQAPRRFFGDKHWNEPLKWNRDALAAGVRRRVFCSSMADVFEDRRDLDEQRARLWKLIAETPALDWQLLTKRPENLASMLPWGAGGEPWLNVWLGTTVEDQQRANERIPHLVAAPAAVRFLSCEPLLEAVDLDMTPAGDVLSECECFGKGCEMCMGLGRIHWVIVGGESGSGSRPMRLKWARDLIEQCNDADVAVFFKQAGEKPMVSEKTWRGMKTTLLLNANARDAAPEGFVVLKVSGKGGDIGELPGGGAKSWPREFPVVAR